MLGAAGLSGIPAEAAAALADLARAIDPGDFRQTAEKIALYKLGDPAPLSESEVADLAPATLLAEGRDVINAALDYDEQSVGLLMHRLEGQGVQPVALCIEATRFLRAVHAVATDPSRLPSVAARIRPPLFGERRDRMARQARAWGSARLEAALAILVETDLTLRSSSRAPGMAVMERALIRIAMMDKRT
jgi:DNA polymerase-3 subunit delta